MLQRKATFEPGPDLPDGKAQTDQQKSEDTGNEMTSDSDHRAPSQSYANRHSFPFSLQPERYV